MFPETVGDLNMMFLSIFVRLSIVVAIDVRVSIHVSMRG